jgi:uncharacterized protein YfaT (DUF1175 family)
MRRVRLPLLGLLAFVLMAPAAPAGQGVLADESDRAAFRAWFRFLADAQFYRQTHDVTDCAALVRHAYREALRTHGPEWVRRSGLPLTPTFPDVRRPPRAPGSAWPLFRISSDPDAGRAEFADAATLIRFNAIAAGRDTAGMRPGDLLYFHQPGQTAPDHLMVFVGRSEFERDHDDWIVYHTGPDDEGPGEVRKVRLADLVQHPNARWRPLTSNPRFVGLFRLAV